VTVRLQNRFTVPATPDEAFAALLDLERVAPCMPGAELTGRDGDHYHGRLKLRIGPITAAYQGTVTVEESDASARRARLSASGREIGGQGGASATVVATVAADGDGRSEVEVTTDLDIRGKAAQFGRGALGEVTQRVLDQFARNLEASLGAGAGVAAAPAPVERGAATPAAPAPAAEDLDVLRAVAGPLLARVAPVLAGLVVGFVVGRLTRRAAPPMQPMWGPPPPWWTAPQV
jgi:uncharacterized protein